MRQIKGGVENGGVGVEGWSVRSRRRHEGAEGGGRDVLCHEEPRQVGARKNLHPVLPQVS